MGCAESGATDFGSSAQDDICGFWTRVAVERTTLLALLDRTAGRFFLSALLRMRLA
jgi:hypothetical protein